MSDVEKYGLFALVFVVGVLGLILVYGGDDGLATEEATAPVVIRKPSEARLPPARSSGNAPRGASAATRQPAGPRTQPARGRPLRSYKVESLVADKGPFAFDEPPVAYPGERSVSPRIASSEGRRFHTIRPGETLMDVSKRYLGTTARWRDILTLNPGLDPRKMQVGDTIVVQGPAAAPERGAAPAASRAVAVSAPPARVPGAERTYLVKKGDTLGAIAQRELGSVRHSGRLFEANKDVLSSPDKLEPGMKLRIP